jgi:hypothetical protein
MKDTAKLANNKIRKFKAQHEARGEIAGQAAE